MTTEIKVPVLPESVADATVATWHVQVGEKFSRDQVLVDIETDKVVLEVPATADGVLTDISQIEGATVLGEQVIGTYSEGGAEAVVSATDATPASAASNDTGAAKVIDIVVPVLPESVADATVATWHVAEGDTVSVDQNLVDIETDKVVLEVVAQDNGVIGKIIHVEGDTVLGAQKIGELNAGAAASSTATATPDEAVSVDELASPSVRRLMTEKGLSASDVTGSGKGGRISKEDVEAALAAKNTTAAPAKSAPVVQDLGERSQKRVPMTRLRKTIATRLLEAKNSTAMLTTFNEVNMKPIMDLRKQYKDIFEKTHDTRLGFMSFYVKAVTEALKRYPAVNASIDGDDIVYHNFFDISIAVSTPRGLVTPVLRDSDQLSMAGIENGIRDLALKVRDGKLSMADMTGGNFTITNGGVFGSLLSTPILNLPQAAILGMHKIQDRPMAVDGKVEILPMMYLALSYDHRLIDGKESVGFLVTIKELLEDPARLLLDV